MYGTGGHAKVVASIIENTEKRIDSIFDDNNALSHLSTYRVIGQYDAHYNPEIPLIICIGNNETRKKLSKSIMHQFDKAIHCSAIIDNSVHVGDGSVVLHLALIQRDATIGKHCIINSKASVDHECQIGDFVHIAPNATLCGNVHVGEGTFIGAGAIVIPNITIGQWCIIGAGTVVLKDIPDNCIVVGNPSRIIKRTF